MSTLFLRSCIAAFCNSKSETIPSCRTSIEASRPSKFISSTVTSLILLASCKNSALYAWYFPAPSSSNSWITSLSSCASLLWSSFNASNRLANLKSSAVGILTRPLPLLSLYSTL